MNIEVNEKIEELLREIAKMKNCSVETAAITVLERYAERAKNEIERAHKVADKF